MTYEIYRVIFYIASGLGVVFLVVSMLLFWLFKIPKVISDLSGRTAKKAIENIRKQNVESGDNRYKVSAVNRERGRVTDRMTPSGQLIRPQEQINTGVITEKIANNADQEAMILPSQSEDTELLNKNLNETELLNETRMNETMILSPQTQKNSETTITVAEEICFLHTDVIIE